ncbi:MAG: glycosyltransferase family 39 protein [Anaerolineaceae bacterium]|nr:glycosyltransferase family 39 protein [Anaerolineaceae bacterium]
MSDRHTSPVNIKKPSSRLGSWLFLLGIAVYLFTRLIRLADFPIYFFTDEAIQTQQAADLVTRGFRDGAGIFLPTYFENGGQFNLSLSVYAQLIPTLIFGKHVWVTRGTAMLLTLGAAVSLGFTLKEAFKSRTWWLGPLLLAAVPAWFLHSRTAFETTLMVSFYAAFIYFYLRYRSGRTQTLYLALITGALAFYSYSPGQVIVVITGLMLLISDARYHWQHRKTALKGLALIILLALPYLRFTLTEGGAQFQHLTLLNSYWVKPFSVWEKIGMYFVRYLKGLNPFYWFWPNPSLLGKLWPNVSLPTWLFSTQFDLARHTMFGYGHIFWAAFPFWVAGLIRCIRRFKDPAHRTLILATLAAPSGAALVDWGITRGLVFIIPATLMIALGVEMAVTWLRSKWPQLSQMLSSLVLFAVLTGFSFGMMADALTNGPTWTNNYGLDGMQYGARQVFTRAAEIAQSEPETTIYVSSTWANGSDVLLRYFADGVPNLQMGNINAWALDYRPLDDSMLFVMTEDDLDFIHTSGKFTGIRVDETLPYPDGSAGFYFVRLAYVPDILDILAEERVARQALVTTEIQLDGRLVTVAHSALDINEIDHAFDGDPTTLIRTLEANPLKIVLNYHEPIQRQSATLLIGGPPTRVTVTAYLAGNEVASQTQEVGQSPVTRELTLTFDDPVIVDEIRIEMLSVYDGEIGHVHLWEVTLR